MKLFDEFYRWVSSKAAHGNPLNHVVTTLLSMGIPVDEDAAVWVIAKWLMGGVIVVLPSGVHLNGVPNGEGVRFCDFTSPISRVAGGTRLRNSSPATEPWSGAPEDSRKFSPTT